MKKERKFRFVGDPKQWTTLNKGEVFSGNYRITPYSKTILEYKESYPLDWQEVTEQEGCYAIPKTETNRIPNQDQPASSMTKFEMAVFMVLQGMVSDKYVSSHLMPEKAISIVEETFKQLENLKK